MFFNRISLALSFRTYLLHQVWFLVFSPSFTEVYVNIDAALSRSKWRHFNDQIDRLKVVWRAVTRNKKALYMKRCFCIKYNYEMVPSIAFNEDTHENVTFQCEENNVFYTVSKKGKKMGWITIQYSNYEKRRGFLNFRNKLTFLLFQL